MALAVSATVNQVEGITRNDLLKRFIRETGLGQYGTATGGSTTTIVDTSVLQSTQFNATQHVGGWGRIGKDFGGAGAAPENEQRPITTYAPSSGTITVNPAFTASPVVSDEYQLWLIDPTVVKDFLDQILQEDIVFPHWTLLSDIPDFDMEQDNTTDWTASGSTIAKNTGLTFGLRGKRRLRVTNTGADGFARPANNFQVIPGKSYFVTAWARSVSGSFTSRLRAFDITNNAAITNGSVDGLVGPSDSTSEAPMRLWLTFTAPNTCRIATVQLIGVEATAVIDWDDIVVFCQDDSSISLPWWVKNKRQILGIFRLNPEAWDSNGAGGVWSPVLKGELDNRWDFHDDAFGRGQLEIVARQGALSSYPLFICGLRNETVYANDAVEEKLADPNLLIAALAYRVFSYLSHPVQSGLLESKWISLQLVRWKGEFRDLQKRNLERISEIRQSIAPLVSFSDYNTNRYGEL